MTQAIVSTLTGETICIPVNSLQDLQQSIYEKTQLPFDSQWIRTIDGRSVTEQDLEGTVFLALTGRMLGGKGGFGSMLRAQGGRMNAQKTTNFEACRDLNGRRIRTVNEAKKLQEELDALPEREAEKREKIKKKIEEGLKEREKRKYLFDDNQFLEDKEEVIEDVKSAVSDVLKRRKIEEKPTTSKAVVTSLFDDELSSDEEEEEEEIVKKSTKGKQKA